MFLFGLNLFQTETLANFLINFQQILLTVCPNITQKNFNFFHANIDIYNKLYLNLQTKYKDLDFKTLDCLYLLNVDQKFEIFFKKNFKFLKNIFTIYQGHHYNQYINIATLILPSKPAIQEIGSFVNLNGNILHINDILHDDNLMVKDNLLILYSVFSTLFSTLKTEFKKIFTITNLDYYNPALQQKQLSNKISLYATIKLKNNILQNFTLNTTFYKFYANDNISLASQLMSNCNKTLVKRSNY